jgi:hypothetical protein
MSATSRRRWLRPPRRWNANPTTHATNKTTKTIRNEDTNIEISFSGSLD